MAGDYPNNSALFLQPVMMLPGYNCVICGVYVINGTYHLCWHFRTVSSPVAIAPCPSCGYCLTCGRKNT
jgi:hypothetical protein